MTHLPNIPNAPHLPRLPKAEHESVVLAWRSLLVLLLLVVLGGGAGALLGVFLTHGFDSLNLPHLVSTSG